MENITSSITDAMIESLSTGTISPQSIIALVLTVAVLLLNIHQSAKMGHLQCDSGCCHVDYEPDQPEPAPQEK